MSEPRRLTTGGAEYDTVQYNPAQTTITSYTFDFTSPLGWRKRVALCWRILRTGKS